MTKFSAAGRDMGFVHLGGNPPIEIILRRSALARRISLRVSRTDGRVTLSMPNWTAESEAMDFAREKEGWIRQNLAQQQAFQKVHTGGCVLLEGQEIHIVPADGRSVRFDGSQLQVPGSQERSGSRVAAFMKVIARQRLSAASDHYAALVGEQYRGITIRDTRSRWGSCTTDGNLMYSWRLIMAPPAVLDYVAAHEVAHLVEMNHSDAYWRIVDRIYPGYKAPRKWLRTNGARLHSFQFQN